MENTSSAKLLKSTGPLGRDVEEVIDAVVRRRIDASDKKHDRAISKSEGGNKKLEEEKARYFDIVCNKLRFMTNLT